MLLAQGGTPIPTGVDLWRDWQLAQIFPTLSDFVSHLFPKVLLLAGIIFFILIVVAGIGVISGAGGDDAHAKEQSRAFLTYAVIGFIIIFGSYWILQIINYITGGSLSGIL